VKYTVHSHAEGSNAVPITHKLEIAQAVSAMISPVRRGTATALRDQFIGKLMEAGWSGEVSVSPSQSGVTITSMKEDTGLCLQTGGNMSRIYADILKLQALYVDEVISCAAFVLPSAPVAHALGDNLAQADRLIRELAIFKKVITLPLLVYSLET
jgi:hypothetical protein